MTARRAYWICQLAGWSIYVAITIVQSAGAAGFGAARAIAEPLLAAAVGISLTHAVRGLMLRRGWLAQTSGGLAVRVGGASLLLACVHVGVLATIELVGYGDHPPSPVLVVVFAVMRWTLVFLVWLALYVGFALIEQRRRHELERVELELALQAAKLRALETALNPHFLFNALNTVRALVAEDAVRADAAITQLARLLRYALAAGREELVTMARELEIVDDYLAIELLRLDTRLRIERDISPEAARAAVPAMIVQTLVENAIKHGISRLPGGGTLRISARIADRRLTIEIENPRAPVAAISETTGIGLANATERLRLLCGEDATLRLDLADDRATARLTIPQVAP